MISEPVLMQALGRLMAMPFFPVSENLVKLAVLDELPQIAANDDQLNWLVQRVTKLYNQWPGLSEIRAVYCSKFKPLDGIEVHSGVYPDGIPSERPSPPPLPALPSGHEASVDPQVEASIRAVAESKDLNRLGKRHRPVPDIVINEVPPERRITQADVDRAVDELHRKRALRELGLRNGNATKTG